MENGFRMYLDAKGGKLGGRAIELVVADEGGGPDTGVPAAQKLLQQDRVTTLVGIVNSAVALGVRDLVTDAKVPLIIANAGANAITGEQRSDYVWRTSFTNGEVAGAPSASTWPGASWATARRS
jgi:branched-chain amino acid transport system substrate-binding protein